MTTRASIDDIRRRKGEKRRKLHKLMDEARRAHGPGLTEEARAARYDAIMAQVEEIEEGRG
mgnify:CR=1 FL=1